jgi:hypothetical protein
LDVHGAVASAAPGACVAAAPVGLGEQLAPFAALQLLMLL